MGRRWSTINNLCPIKQISYFNKNLIPAPLKRLNAGSLCGCCTSMKNLRNSIIDLLDRWENNSINEEKVLIEAEVLFDNHYKEQDYPKNDYRSIIIEVLSQLEIIHHQWILKEDISQIRKFLNTTTDNELKAWRDWQNIDLKKRESSIKKIRSMYKINQPHNIFKKDNVKGT